MAADKSNKTAPGVPFPPGVSGNPGGRPKKLAELSTKISEMDDKHRLRLEAIAEGKGYDAKDSIAAIKLLWAYAHGNPAQAITGPNGADLKVGVIVLPSEETD